jgi:acetylornithine deacetylase/succinyl-diaminopimelate desuccinylase-like protein
MSDITAQTEKVFSALDPTATAQALSELVAARSDNPGAFEAQAAAVFARQRRDAGLATEIIPIRDDRPNVVARLSGGSREPVVVLNSHFDTVQTGEGWTIDPWGGAIKGGRVWGLGSTDAKGQLVAMLAAVMRKLASLNARGPRRDPAVRELPSSNGTPTIPIVGSAERPIGGAFRKVANPQKRLGSSALTRCPSV